MSMFSIIEGNLLDAPTQRYVPVKGEQRSVVSFRLMSDYWKRNGEELVQDDDKTSPVGCTIWSERLGEQVMKLFRKGMRVMVIGDVHLHTWDSDETEGNAELRCVVNDVAVKLNRVEGITMRAKRAPSNEPAANAPSGRSDDLDDDTPY
jgi:single-stranded DNA-binding protein